MAEENGSKRSKNGRFARGNQGGPGRPRKDQAAPSPLHPVLDVRMDGFANMISGVGALAYDKRMSTSHQGNPISDEEAANLWETNPLAARIVETWPNEMLREGYDVVIGSNQKDDRERGRELSELVEARMQEMLVDDALWKASAYEDAYGGGAALLGVKDFRELSQPLDVSRVKSFDWINVFEPQEIYPYFWYNDPRSPKFSEPSHYKINTAAQGPSKDGSNTPQNLLIHESRLLIFPGIRVSRLRHHGAASHSHWGGSKLTRVYNVLRDHGMGYDAAAILMQDFSQAVYRIKGLAEASVQSQDAEIKARLQAVELARSIIRAIVIDSEEDFGRQQTPVTGLPDLLDRFNALLAAAADMPLTLLMGQSPGGMNATGDSDIRFFYDRVKAKQNRRLRPMLERIVQLVFQHLGQAEPEKWCIRFRPLWQQSDKEKAEARNLQAKTDEIYIGNMVYSPEDAARSRFSGDGFSFDTSIDFAARESMENEAKELERRAQEQSILSAQAASNRSSDNAE